MKLTKERTKRHEEAIDLCNKDQLSLDEKYFILNNYSPAADNNITKNAAFFTPENLARDFISLSGCNWNGSKWIDLCAGIGILSRYIFDYMDNPVVCCVEKNPEYVRIGKRCVPEAEWICGDVYDLDLLLDINKRYGFFDVAISNPPYGNIKTTMDKSWLRYNGSADLEIAEICCRMAKTVDLILPPGSVPYNQNKIEENNKTKKFFEKTGYNIYPNVSLDMNYYEFENTMIKPMMAYLGQNWESEFEPMGFGDTK